ncbi:M24 family metallopeptidase [Oceanithermus desulfurans]|uniref:Peptidase M24 n=2 Tax=Oceanithermus desulfurans TaxID=227924 RepID=A0A511RGJ0_9DEIN|nr:M24 family metallopeptidase [Oceanithermus desulfurans]MBB6030205.1 Xaa-Pro aminopeptidase [Oceanithermus desulfurans]GEM88763.1 peptidase M24 [Oceanithermus desulfurans NBRC 100063]
MDTQILRQALAAAGLPAWLFYSFGASNPLALEALELTGEHLTRRFAYLVPATGEPRLLAHRLELERFDHLPGARLPYARWQEFDRGLERLLEGVTRAALDYQPGARIPYLSRVDAGFVERVRALGVEVVSAARPLLHLQTWTAADLAAHRRAAAVLHAARDAALAFLRSRLPDDPPRELEVQRVMLNVFAERGVTYDHPPIVAFGANAARPHYAPQPGSEAVLQPGDVVLLDLWAREPEGVYADITWMAGWRVAPEVREAWEAVAAARDRAVALIREAFAAGRRPAGWEADRAAREVLESRGYGAYVLHRTGHHLGRTAPHGSGTHLDDFESHDTRPLLPGLAFTVEPGVYLEGRFGLRSEIDVFLHETGPEVTTEVQTALETL